MIPPLVPTLSTEPGTRFFYPPDGRVYFVTSIDHAEQSFVLERLGKAGLSAVPPTPIPRLEEAASLYVQGRGDDDEPAVFRATLTHEIEQNGRFLTAKYVKNARVAG